MDWTAFGIEMIEKMITAVPQLVIVLTMVATSLKSVKKKTADFPDQVKVLKTEFMDAYGETKVIIKEALQESKEEISKVISDITVQMKKEVTEVMGSMEKELATYREQIQAVKTQANLLVKENRAMFDIIIDLVAKNPELVKKGLSGTITDMLTMTQEELINYSVELIDNLPLLETVLKEAMVNFDLEDIDSILEALGYERKDTEATS